MKKILPVMVVTLLLLCSLQSRAENRYPKDPNNRDYVDPPEEFFVNYDYVYQLWSYFPDSLTIPEKVYAITGDAVCLTWWEMGISEEWTIAYGTEDDIETMTLVPEVPDSDPEFLIKDYWLTGLENNTTYYVYIRSDFEGDHSDWTGPVTFTTLGCNFISTPWMTNFNEDSLNLATLLDQECMNAFKYRENLTTVYNDTLSGFVLVNTNVGDNATAKLRYSGGDNHRARFVMPAMDFTDDERGPMVTFDWYYMLGDTTSSSNAFASLSYSLDGEEWFSIGYPYHRFRPASQGGSGWETYAVGIPQLANRYGYVSFDFHGSGTSYYMYIDNLGLREIPEVWEPTNFVINRGLGRDELKVVTGNAACFSWKEFADSEEWTLAYGLAGTPVENMTIVPHITSTHDYWLTDLQPGVEYEAYVRADKGDKHSLWTGPRAFTTLSTPDGNFWQTDFDADDLSNISGLKYYRYRTSPDSYGYSTSTGLAISTTTLSGNATKKLRYTADNNYESRIQFPAFDFRNSDEGAAIFFDWYFYNTNAYNSYIAVQYSLNGVDWYSTGDTIYRESDTQGWETKYCFIPEVAHKIAYIGIMFHGVGTASSYYDYLDNLSVRTIPDIWEPINFAINKGMGANDLQAVGGNAACFSWFEFGDSHQWTLAYGPAGTPIENMTTIPGITYTNNYWLTDLQSNTAYDVYVRSDQSNGHSAWAGPVSFTTLDLTDGIAWQTDFEASALDSIPGVRFYRYRRSATDYAYYPSAPGMYIDSDVITNNATKKLKYASSNDYESRFELPLFDFRNENHGALVTLDWRHYSANNYNTFAAVQYSLDGINWYSTGDTIYRVGPTTSWKTYYIKVPEVANHCAYIGLMFHYVSGGSVTNSVYVDNLTVEAIPDVMAPVELSVNTFLEQVPSVSGNAACLSWIELDNSTEWTVAYGLSGTPVEQMTTISSITENAHYWLTGLESDSTAYDVYVRSDHDGNHSAWTGPVSFITKSCTDSNTWSTDFQVNALSDFPCVSYYRYWSSTALSFSNLSTGLSLYSSSPASSTNKALRYSSTTNYESRFVMPAFDFRNDTEGALFSFDMYHYASNSNNSYVVVQYSFDGVNWIDASEPIYRYRASSAGGEGWGSHHVRITEVANQYAYIAVMFHYAANGTVYFDNFDVHPATACEMPLDFAATPGTGNNATTANITWTDVLGTNNFTLRYGLAGTDLIDMIEIDDIQATSYNLTGLHLGTDYEAYISANCSGTSQSDWTGPLAFTTTGCDNLLPVSYNFDNNSTNWPSCLTKTKTPSSASDPFSIYTTVGYHYSGNASLRFYSTTSNVTGRFYHNQGIDVSAVESGLAVSFQWLHTTATAADYAEVQYSIDHNTWYTIGNPIYRNNGTTDWEEIVRYIPSGFWGNATEVYVGVNFVRAGSNSMYLDDFTVSELEINCFVPENVAVTKVTGDYAMLSWEETWIATEWTIAYGPTGTPVEQMSTVTATGTPNGAIFDLQANTTYDAYVRSNCSANNYGDWSEVVTFTTSDCPSSSQWLIDFEEGNIDSMSCIEHYRVDPSYSNTSSSLTVSQNYNSYTLKYTSTGVNYTSRFVGHACDFRQAEFGAKVSFDVYHFTASSTKYVQLQYSIDGETWVDAGPQITRQSETGGWKTYTVTIPELAYQYGYVGLLFGVGTSTSSVYMYVDNLEVRPAVACEAPILLEATNISDNQFTLNWTEIGTATSWTVRYGIDGSPIDQTMEISDNPTCDLTNLHSATRYIVYVRANENGLHSEWTGPLAVTTTGCPDMLPYSFDFNATTAVPNCITTSTSSANANFVCSGTGAYNGKALRFAKTTATSTTTVAPAGETGNATLQPIALNMVAGAASGDGIEISFMWKHQSGKDSNDDYAVLRYSYDGSDWTSIDTLHRYASTSAQVAKSYTITNLETEGSIIIDFRFVSAGGKYMMIDNLSVVDLGPIDIYIMEDKTETDYSIAPNVTVHVVNNAVFTVTGNLTNNGNAGNLIIEDGAQLVHNTEGVNATMEKNITAYTGTDDNWSLIANPTTSAIDPADVTDMVDGSFDLYWFDQNPADGLEWVNYKSGAFELNANHDGYLYANAEAVTLRFAGELLPSNNNVTTDITYSNGAEFASWNLIGNPFACNAYLGQAYYRVNNDGTELEATLSSSTIAPLEGVFVEASSDVTKAAFSRTAPAAGKGSINLMLTQGHGLIDKAIVSFGNNRLGKFSLKRNTSKLYIAQDDKDFAVVNSDSEGEMPVSFKATKDGQYTIGVNADVDMNYLHLIDNMTGADIDLLDTPSYTFNAKTTDYASRFRLVYSSICGDADGDNAFAYFNGSEWVVTNNGKATLQVIDMMGRVMSSESINGNAHISTNGLSTGVYVMRLINGENVMVQKVVIK